VGTCFGLRFAVTSAAPFSCGLQFFVSSIKYTPVIKNDASASWLENTMTHSKPAAVAGADAPAIVLREPTAADGAALFELIQACPPLDQNSRYCNLLQVSHFARTAVVAELGGAVVGSITGYLKPDDPTTLFIWQVAVHEAARGQRLATRMMDAIVDRPVCRNVRYLETTIDPANAASWRAFEKFAEARRAPSEQHLLFSRDAHFAGTHGDEVLLRIGPFRSAAAASAP
jgi:L-2,4-diaminobutyric acid acetyltransferase